MKPTYCCPICGEPLKQGQYYYDMENDTMRVERCPNNCESEGEKCVLIDDCRPPKQESEYNEFGIDTRTGLPFGTPWDDPDADYEQ